MKKVGLIFLMFLLVSSVFAQNINKKDAQGRKQGPWQKTYPNSSLLEYKGQFKDDKPVGTFTYYYKNNKVKMIIVHDAKTGRSRCQMFHEENGKLMANGVYQNELKDSIWDFYGPSGRKSTQESYKKGKLHGTYTIYYVPEDINDKSLKASYVANYVDGLKEGLVMEYFDTGVIKSRTPYIKGKRHGVVNIYHPNGKLMIQERWKNGEQHGWQTAHDQTGKETGRQLYRLGERLEGKRKEDYLNSCKKAGVDPNKLN
jgi:antitoxin component YwqK of YwqJK toxin-antitoxin module